MSSKSLDPTTKPTGKQIRKALIDLDLTVIDLAKAMEVSPIYIRRIYQERRQAKVLRQRIAEFFRARYRKLGMQVPRAFKQLPTNEKELAA